jgi:hypothetical protein
LIDAPWTLSIFCSSKAFLRPSFATCSRILF